jgi:hypothetical protein
MRDWSPKKPRVMVDGAELRAMYWDEGLSLAEIAARLNCTKENIYRLKKKHGIPTRPVDQRYTANARAKQSETRKRQFSPMSSPFKRGCPNVRVDGKKVRLYRLVAEAILGRPLNSRECVHHCNNCQADCRPANLWVFPSRSDHTRYHRTGILHPDTIKLVPYCGELA